MNYRFLLLSFVSLFLATSFQTFAQTSPDSLAMPADPDAVISANSGKWQIGVYDYPPFMIKTENGRWEGISIRLWEDIAAALDITYDFEEIEEESVNAELVSLRMDAVLAVPARAEDMDDMTHSQVYYLSTMGVAEAKTNSLSNIAKSLFTMRFFKIVVSLTILLLIVGLIIWAVERRHNEKQFGGKRGFWQGIGAGFWWAGVTMTTIGYGDKAPVTTLGRAVALLWMLIAMAITASLTAAIVSAVGMSSSQNLAIPEDLRSKKTATISGTDYEAYLKDENIKTTTYKEVSQSLNDLHSTKIEAVAHDLAELRYHMNENANVNARVYPTEMFPRRYTIGLSQKKAPLAKQINKAMLKVINEPGWLKEINKYAPEMKRK